jgi:Transposase and inactivated derivatives
MRRQGELSVADMCALAALNRATFYRWLQRSAPNDNAMELRGAMQRICVEHRRYGYRRVTAALRSAGFRANHKRVLRLMQQDNLLALRKRKFVVTTESKHALPVYSNYAAHMQIQGPDELWVADITYIRLRREFVYLAVVLDAWSRKVVGWALERHLQASLCKTALERAIEARHPAPGLVHHSDRGVQYASAEYIGVLERNRIQGSMSRPGNPWDNARCESFMKTLKQEEISCGEYADLEDLEAHLVNFIDGYYNGKRLHSSLGYRSPEEFERQRAKPAA